MTYESAGADQRGERSVYVKPFVRNLDVEDTEGNKYFTHPSEGLTTYGVLGRGPS